MPGVTLNVKNQIKMIIKRFKFEELELAVLPIFPELSWERIKSKLVNNHESLTTLHALRIIEEDINKAKISNEILKDRLASLEVIDVSRHSKRKTWYGHVFKGKSNQNLSNLKEIEEQIESRFNEYQMEIKVKAVKYDGIIFLSIKNKSKKKGMKMILPTYFSLVMNETFFFCSRKVVLKNILLAVVCGLGYQNFKQIKLMGKDIHSLIQMLLARKEAESQGNLTKDSIRFKPTAPVVTIHGIDFTQHNQRQEYASKCFGENPPTFEFLRVKSFDQKWKHKDALQKLPNEVIYTGIEFRSSNIPNLLKNLVTQKILLTPLPCYAANIISIGRNDLTINSTES